MSTATSDLAAFPTLAIGSGQVTAGATGGQAPLSGYAHASRTCDPVEPSRQPHQSTGQRPRTIKATVSDRHALAQHLSDALAFSKDLEASAASSDPQGAAIAGLDLRNSLRALWKLRHVRSDDWATVVNKLQVVTSQVEFEKFTRDMAMAVRMSIESHLRPDADNDDVRAVTLLLERAEMSPWKNLAPPAQEA